jgi:excisionase family DNA binding protein
MQNQTQSYFNLEEAAHYLRVSPRFLRYRLKKEATPGIKMGRKWIFRKENLDAWAEQFRVSSE